VFLWLGWVVGGFGGLWCGLVEMGGFGVVFFGGCWGVVLCLEVFVCVFCVCGVCCLWGWLAFGCGRRCGGCGWCWVGFVVCCCWGLLGVFVFVLVWEELGEGVGVVGGVCVWVLGGGQRSSVLWVFLWGFLCGVLRGGRGVGV